MSNNISLYNKLAQAQQLIIEVMTELGTTPVQMMPPYAVGPVENFTAVSVLDESPDDEKRLGEHIADMTGAFSQMFPDMGDSEKGLLIALYMSLLGFDYQMEDSQLPDFVKLIKRGIITVVYQWEAQIAYTYRPHFVGVQDFKLPRYDWRELDTIAKFEQLELDSYNADVAMEAERENWAEHPPVALFEHENLSLAYYRPVDPIENHDLSLKRAVEENVADIVAEIKRSDILPSELALIENPDSEETALVRGLEGQGIYLDDAQRTALLSIFWELARIQPFNPDDASDVALAGLIYKNVIDVVGDRAAEINPDLRGYFEGAKSFDLPDFHWGELNDMTMMFRSMR